MSNSLPDFRAFLSPLTHCPGFEPNCAAVRPAGVCIGGVRGGDVFRPGPLQGLYEHFGRLGAFDDVARVDDEERHPVHPEGVGLSRIGCDLGGVGVALEDSSGLVSVDAGGSRELHQGIMVANNLLLGKIGGEQALREGVLATTVAGEVQEPVCVPGVWQNPVGVDNQAFPGGEVRDLLLFARRFGRTDAVGSVCSQRTDGTPGT